MMYLMSQFWPWLLVALMIGLFVGWWTCADEPTRWWTGWVPIGLAIFLVALAIAVFRMLPGRTGLMLDSALLMFSSYLLGCCVGCLFKQWLMTKSAPALAAGHAGAGHSGAGYAASGHGTAGAAASGHGQTQYGRAGVATGSTSPARDASTGTEVGAAAATAGAAAKPAGAGVGAGTSASASYAGAGADDRSGGTAGSGDSAAAKPAGTSAGAGAADTPGGIAGSGDSAAAAHAATATASAGSNDAASPRDAAPNAGTVSLASTAAGSVDAGASAVGSAPAAGSAVHAAADLPAEPELENVPVNIPGKRPRGYVAPLAGVADDLKRIRGIGKQNEGRLHALGIWHFRQIAEWTRDEIDWVSSYLAFPGRIDREDWVSQAKQLAAGIETEFSQRVARGEVATSKDTGDAGQSNIAELPQGAPKPNS